MWPRRPGGRILPFEQQPRWPGPGHSGQTPGSYLARCTLWIPKFNASPEAREIYQLLSGNPIEVFQTPYNVTKNQPAIRDLVKATRCQELPRFGQTSVTICALSRTTRIVMVLQQGRVSGPEDAVRVSLADRPGREQSRERQGEKARHPSTAARPTFTARNGQVVATFFNLGGHPINPALLTSRWGVRFLA